MEKIVYVEPSRFSSSVEGVTEILRTHFNIQSPTIARTENGKPYLQSPALPLFFSVSHTKAGLFIAFCDENVGLDCELCSRELNLPLLLKRFSQAEREEISSTRDFLVHWTVKEAAVKWLGETLASTLSKLAYVKGRLYYEGLELPVKITTLEINGHILSTCSERDFSTAQIIP